MCVNAKTIHQPKNGDEMTEHDLDLTITKISNRNRTAGGSWVQGKINDEYRFDALVFAGAARPWRDVMVAGHWVLREHQHAQGAAVAARFCARSPPAWFSWQVRPSSGCGAATSSPHRRRPRCLPSRR